jgi:hypothetical protein
MLNQAQTRWMRHTYLAALALSGAAAISLIPKSSLPVSLSLSGASALSSSGKTRINVTANLGASAAITFSIPKKAGDVALDFGVPGQITITLTPKLGY